MLSSLDNLSVTDAVYFVATLLRRSNLCKTYLTIMCTANEHQSLQSVCTCHLL